ncbi:MAG: energy-coupling factor transporter transmembrane protein EcfT [Clostridia bacterium]|jgi:cobalt/nickel transport system permease protein|nr:energy-coupling factor transporter transmembrane protein EcfT [Clostridia bacterium]MCI1999997.1 energy-coupling factor transporter transmembrane protein EcfT [Clostridia bacterium]MCI2014469.1 energy-coupling factor transporter transmembrane protein EcfT [Clostridia bacterium]
MPEWLLKDENYIPQSDKDAFITKSIMTLLGVLSRIRAQSVYKEKKFKVSAALKVAFTFVLILLISISKSIAFTIIINVYLLAVLSMMNGEEIIKILKVSIVTSAFTFVILLPAAFWGNLFSSIFITSKVFATVTAVNMLSHSTRWNSITSALKRFYVPDIFILVMDITIKYIFMLGEFSLNMFYALKLRSVGKNKSKYTSLSGIAGTMFIKSNEMAEDMYSAMECRGFTGEYQVINKKYKMTFPDFVYIIMNIALILIFIYMERV